MDDSNGLYDLYDLYDLYGLNGLKDLKDLNVANGFNDLRDSQLDKVGNYGGRNYGREIRTTTPKDVGLASYSWDGPLALSVDTSKTGEQSDAFNGHNIYKTGYLAA